MEGTESCVAVGKFVLWFEGIVTDKYDLVWWYMKHVCLVLFQYFLFSHIIITLQNHIS